MSCSIHLGNYILLVQPPTPRTADKLPPGIALPPTALPPAPTSLLDKANAKKKKGKNKGA